MRIIVLFAFSMLVFLACKPKAAQSTEAAAPAAVVLPSDFQAFYERFHTDSMYQMDHISWPLESITMVQDDSLRMMRKQVSIDQKSWHMHRKLNDADFTQSWTELTPDVLEETIKYSAANYGMIRRFAKIGNEWNLIYYQDMQEMK